MLIDRLRGAGYKIVPTSELAGLSRDQAMPPLSPTIALLTDRVVFLSGGTIIEEGPAHQVLTSPRNPITARFLNAMETDKPTVAPA